MVRADNMLIFEAMRKSEEGHRLIKWKGYGEEPVTNSETNGESVGNNFNGQQENIQRTGCRLGRNYG
jgi:hypothetical protein